jgi:hypothetical protein
MDYSFFSNADAWGALFLCVPIAALICTTILGVIGGLEK